MHIQFVRNDGRKSLTQGPYERVIVDGNSLQLHEGGNILEIAMYDPSIGMWIEDSQHYWDGYVITS